MRAMVLNEAGQQLQFDAKKPVRQPGPHEVLLRVHACGVCRTDLHIVDGELAAAKLPLVPGHEIVGTVEARGALVERIALGQRVGVPWLGWTCAECVYCRSGRENLCDSAQFTGCLLYTSRCV